MLISVVVFFINYLYKIPNTITTVNMVISFLLTVADYVY